jgi:hypothetical protein
MALFKSDEEKAAEQAERDRAAAAYQQQQADAAAARAQQAHAATPIGQAEQATRDGLAFFEVQLVVGRSTREASWGTTSGGEEHSTQHLGVLGQIEALGWRLEHAGYVFVQTGESSTQKILGTGQQIAVSGSTVGIYLFRRVTPPA